MESEGEHTGRQMEANTQPGLLKHYQHHGDSHKSPIRGSTTAAGFVCESCG